MIRIVIADDHELIREGLKRLLRPWADLELCGEAGSGDEAISQTQRIKPDVLLLDMSMPGINGLELIAKIAQKAPDTRILVVSMHPEERYAERAMQAGAAGFVNKAAASQELLGAIRQVAAGEAYLSPAAAQALARRAIGLAHGASHDKLSPREYQIMEMLVSGDTITAIANRLSLSVKTVSTHKTRILEKLNLESLAQLVRYAMEHGLIDAASREAGDHP